MHFGKQLQCWVLAVAAATAKYRHVTLVFSPVRWSQSDMRARKWGSSRVSPMDAGPQLEHTHTHTFNTHTRPQMAGAPFQGPSALEKKALSQNSNKLPVINGMIYSVFIVLSTKFLICTMCDNIYKHDTLSRSDVVLLYCFIFSVILRKQTL